MDGALERWSNVTGCKETGKPRGLVGWSGGAEAVGTATGNRGRPEAGDKTGSKYCCAALALWRHGVSLALLLWGLGWAVPVASFTPWGSLDQAQRAQTASRGYHHRSRPHFLWGIGHP